MDCLLIYVSLYSLDLNEYHVFLYYLNIAYQVILILMIYIGGIKQDIFIWSLADFGLGIMTVINILVIIPIAKPALDSLKNYEKELK